MRDPDRDGGEPQPWAEAVDQADAAVGRLKRRADFLRAAKGKRWHGKAFSLQAGRSSDREAGPARFGLTVTKKVGNAVVRNRARRRLREAIRLHPDLPARQARDYVLVARLEAIRVPFATLQKDLSAAVRSVHAEARLQDAAKRLRREATGPVATVRPQE